MVPTKAGLAGCLLVGLLGGPDPELLIGQLGSPRYAEREAATMALDKLGEIAMPALRDARSDRDPEVKGRAEFLLETIERRMISRPTIIRLSERDSTYSKVVQQIAAAEKVPIRFSDQGMLARRTLVAPSDESIPFWPLLDRLNLVPQWEFEPGFGGGPGFRRPPTLRLVDRVGESPVSSDSGPFRIFAKSPIYAFEPQPFEVGFRPQGRAREVRPDRELDLLIPIEVMAEPRLTLKSLGAVQILEAVDDLGQAFAASASGNLDVGQAMILGERSASVLPLQLRLKPLPRRGTMLKRLRGSVPVQVEARRIEPTRISLAMNSPSEQKPIPCGGTTILVHACTPAADGSGNFHVEASFRQEASPLVALNGRFANRRLQELLNDSDPLWQNLEVVDASGQAMTISDQRTVGVSLDGGIRKAITIEPKDAESPPPAEIRFFGRMSAMVDVPFDFADLRLP